MAARSPSREAVTAIATTIIESIARDRVERPSWSPLPHQVAPPGDWLVWLLVAGRGCIAAETLIYDPSTGTETAVETLAARGEPITVLALTERGPRSVRASAPFLKGTAPLYRVTLANGSAVTVTDEHRFLTPFGWRRLYSIKVDSELGYGPGLSAVDVTLGRHFSHDYPFWSRVAAIEPVDVGEFYDLTAPGPANYLAEGIWHHNSGKTDACAHWLDRHVMGPPCIPGYPGGHRPAIIAPTLGDAVEACVNGPSGLKAHNPGVTSAQTTGGTYVRWPNGAEGKLFGAYTPEDVERLRAGGNRCAVWSEELAAWPKLDAAWDHMMFGLRIGPHPVVVASTTPKPRKLLKALLADSRTAVTRASTIDNPHLDAGVRARLYERYAGTRLGRQELDAEMLEDVEGALWSLAQIDALRVEGCPELLRVVVAIDPPGGDGEQGGEAGIVVAGLGVDGRGYVLGDLSLRASPSEWASVAVAAYRRFEADRIVAEVNYGGQMVGQTIATVDPYAAFKAVHATRGKRPRAEPIAALYEQQRVFHAGSFPDLEDQMATWVPGMKSPDRLDALVWALTELFLEAPESDDSLVFDEPVEISRY